MMDWEKALTLLHVATMSNDFPKLHHLRNAALDELATMDAEEPQEEEE
jgi:hypothetical protein